MATPATNPDSGSAGGPDAREGAASRATTEHAR